MGENIQEGVVIRAGRRADPRVVQRAAGLREIEDVHDGRRKPLPR